MLCIYYLFWLGVKTRQLWLHFRASQSCDESKRCAFNADNKLMITNIELCMQRNRFTLGPNEATNNETKLNVVTTLRAPDPEGTPLYKLYRCVPLQRVWFFSRFGMKSGMVFKGTTFELNFNS